MVSLTLLSGQEILILSKNITGSCLCGEVFYQFLNDVKVFQNCHYSRCRKITGSAHASNIIVEPDKFQWLSGESYAGQFELPEAKHFASCFCKKCGSSLPWKSKSGRAIVIPAGTLDEDSEIKPAHNIYYKNKAPWYLNIEDLKKHQKLPIK